jgi:chromosome segregation ATPase
LEVDLRLRATELAEAQKNLALARKEREEALTATTPEGKEVRELAILLSAATARADQAQNRVETLAAELESDRRARGGAGQETANTNAKEIERQLAGALDRVRSLEGERDRLREEIEGTKEGLNRSKEHINVLQSRRDQMREEIARLKVKLGMAPDAVV